MPQDVPNWPGEDYATFPAAKIRMDLGSGMRTYPLSRFGVRRQLTTFLPEQVRAAAGIAAATGQATLSPVVHDEEDGPQQGPYLSELTSRVGNEVPIDGFFAVAAPAGIQLGDVVLAFQGDSSDPQPAAPTGGSDWSLLDSVGGSGVFTWVWWKIAGSSEPAAYTFQNRFVSHVAVIAVRGWDGSPLTSATLFGPDDSTSDPDTWVIDTPSTTIDRPGLEFRSVMLFISGLGSVFPPDDFTRRLSENSEFSTVQGVATRGRVDTGETGIATWTADEQTGRRMGVTVNVPLADYPAPKRLAPAVRPGHWSPFKQNFKPHVGAEFDARAGLVGEFGEALPVVFVGQVTDENGSTSTPELDLRLVDDSVKLQNPYRVRAVIADSGVEDAGELVFSPGFSATWVMADILAQAGFPTVPPVRDDAVFAASMLGSAQPELAGDVSQESYPFGASEFPYEASNLARTGPAEFAPTSFLPAAADDLYARYNSTRRVSQSILGSSQPSVGIQAVVDWESGSGSAGTSIIDFRTAPGFTIPGASGFLAVRFDQLTRTLAASSVTKTFGSMTVSKVVESGLVEVYAAYELTTWPNIEITITICDATSCTSGTENDTLGPEGGVPVLREVEIEHSGFGLAGIQILNRPDPPGTTAAPYAPATALDPSLNDVTATPGVGEDAGWSVLNDIASAELGAFWFSETGVPTFQNRESLAGIGKTPTELVTRQRFDELAWQISTSEVYGEVSVPFVTQGIDASGLAVWSAGQQHQILGNGSTVFEVQLDHPTIGVDVTFSANDEQNGSGADRSADVRIIDLEQTDETTARFIVRNTSSSSFWLVDNQGRPDLNVVAHAAIVAGGRQEAVSPGAEGNPSLLRVPQNDWLQTSSSASGLSQFLAGQVSEPLPTIPVAGGRLDTRRQLADTVVLVDPVLMEMRHRGVIVGYSLDNDPGRGQQDLQVRLLLDTWADFDQAWNPHMSTSARLRNSEAGETTGAEASLDIAAPTLVEGDRLFAVVAVGVLQEVTPPAGFVEHSRYDGLIQPAGATTREVRVFVFVKDATGSEPGTYSFTTSPDAHMIGVVFAIADPVDGLGPELYITRQPGSWVTDETRMSVSEPVVRGDPLLWFAAARINTISPRTITWQFDGGGGLFDPAPLDTNVFDDPDGLIGEQLSFQSLQTGQRHGGEMVVSDDERSDPSIGLVANPTSVAATWEDFNAHWAGRTWDDFDADPLDAP